LLKIIINKLTQTQQCNKLYLSNLVGILLLSACGGGGGSGAATGGSGSSVPFSTPMFCALFFVAIILLYKKIRKIS